MKRPRPCRACTTRVECALAAHQGLQRPCPGPAPVEDAPMTLQEAAALAVRDWDLYGPRAFDAAIDVLRRFTES